MQLITNHQKPDHLNTITRLIKDSDEMIVCIAFLKNSGLDRLLTLFLNNYTFYVGTDYYITEPAALKKLMKAGHKVYLTTKASCTYHPKIYYFRKGQNISLLTGSANLTGGGLETNFEASVLTASAVGSDLDTEFKKMIEIYAENSVHVTSDLQLSQYEREFELYKKKRKKADAEFKEELGKIHKIDLGLLEKYFKEFLKDIGPEDYKVRVQDYKEIKKLLDAMASATINSAESFLAHYEDVANSFYSSDLLRGKTFFAKGYKKIIAAIQFIQENKQQEAGFVYEKARTLILPVDKFGVNGLTEIMNTYNPTAFSVANGRTTKSLADLGFAIFPNTNKKYFDAAIYTKYNDLIKEIGRQCGANDLGQVDHFLSWYYDKYLAG